MNQIGIKPITIGDFMVGSSVPFIIAEMSGNHNQSLERGLSIIDAAAAAGAHAIKLQTYTADTMTLNVREGDFVIDNPQSLWNGETLYDLYQKAFTPWKWHQPLFDRCREKGIICFSTPFDATSVDFLEELGSPAYKIASFENIDLPLLKKVGATGKPVIMSTGMATLAELDESVRTLREAGCVDLILLKCTSSYPATPAYSNILTIPHMRDLFDCPIGLSDHTMGIGAAVASVALGATVIEKHFTLRRADGGVDSAFSMEPEELKVLVTESERAWQALGSIQYGPSAEDSASLQFRRSLYVAADMAEGESFTPENLRIVRPGSGLPPKYYDTLLGKCANRSLKAGSPVSWEMVG